MRVKPPSDNQQPARKELRASLLALATAVIALATGCDGVPTRTAGAIARPEPAGPSEERPCPAEKPKQGQQPRPGLSRPADGGEDFEPGLIRGRLLPEPLAPPAKGDS